jgi:hypothetical protein
LTFLEIAKPLTARGIPVIPLRPRTKIALLDDWQNRATTDESQIQLWHEEYPEANGAVVAIAVSTGFWFLEVDSHEVVPRIEKETGQKFPETFAVRSSPGKSHFYFRQSTASMRMGNIAQTKESGWSARVDRSYCVSPGSVHPITGLCYEVKNSAEIVEAPEWLIEWLKNQRIEKKSVQPDEDQHFYSGSRNVHLASRAGKMRNAGMSQTEIENTLLRMNQDLCHPPLDENEVRVIAGSISRYDIPRETVLLHGGVPVNGNGGVAVQTAVEAPQHQSAIIPYPVFPDWVMSGTSLYEGFIKPICDINSRYPSFMFMPAVALMLNYLGTRITIEYKPNKPNIFLVLIGRRGRTMKSASVEDALHYFEQAGLLAHGGPGIANAGGKMLVWTPGSPEGFGLEMARTNCKNGVIYYDELSTLTSKAGIENSGLASRLLQLYESAKFQNVVKSKKETFGLEPKTYCACLLACSTDKNFQKDWAKMSAGSSGLDDRMFFLLQPETLKELTPYKAVCVQEGALETRRLIDKAIDQQHFKFSDEMVLQAASKRLGNRAFIRVEKLAIYFAVDLGRDELDSDCCERALAVCEYEQSVKKYLKTFEGVTKESLLQQEIMFRVRQSPEGLTVRDINRVLHPKRYGTSLWKTAYYGLLNMGWLAEIGDGTKSSPRRLISLLAAEDDEDED